MSKTREQIVQDLLRNAAYYWHDPNQDKVNPTNLEDFDPVVDKLFKATSIEIEKLYAELDESRKEIILHLTRALIPEESLLPEPGYTVAQINPKANRIITSPEDNYQIGGQSDTGQKHDFYFTPLFDHDFPQCEVAAILTENHAFALNKNGIELVKETTSVPTTCQFWLGLALPPINKKESISFYLGNRIIDGFDKNYNLFHSATWTLDGDQLMLLKTEKGIKGFGRSNGHVRTKDLPEELDILSGYERQIHHRFKHGFIHIDLPEDAEKQRAWKPTSYSDEGLVEALGLDSPLIWIRIDSTLPMPFDYLQQKRLYPNSIPLINRKIIENYVVKKNYERIVLPLRTNDLFLDMHQVRDTNDRTNDLNGYYQVDFLHPESPAGSFMIKSSARIHRFNQEEASKQIKRLLEVIQDEYSTFKEEGVNRLREDFEVIDKAINRIRNQFPLYFREKSNALSYFCVANFRPNVSRLYYSYWETQGDQIRHLGEKIALPVTSNDVHIANSKSILPIQQGRGEVTPEDYVEQVKITLLSQGRILTRGDIQMLCRSQYGHLLKVVKIDSGLLMDETNQVKRGIIVKIKFLEDLSQQEMEYVRVELQNELNARSAFFSKIKVEVTK